MERLKGWLADYPTTAFRIVATVGMALGTALVVFWCFARRITLQEEIFDSWLIFLAVMSGIDAAQWGMKRATAWRPPQTESEHPTTAGEESNATRSLTGGA